MAVSQKACLVVVGGVLVHLTLGTIYTFGNLSPYVTSYIRKRSTPSDLTYADSVWIFALAAMGQGTSMYFGGLLERRLGPRLTVLIGAWFQSLGVVLTYFTIKHSFGLMILSYGAMFGVGVGIAYAVPMAVGMRWLPEKKGLVNGFVVAGFGGGSFIFVLIQTAFINPENKPADLEVNGEKYFTQDDILDRVPTVFLLCGGSYAVMQLIGCLFLWNPPSYEVPKYHRLGAEKEKETQIGAEEETTSLVSSDADDDQSFVEKHVSADNIPTHGSTQEDRAMTPSEMLRTPGFYSLWFIFLLNGQGVVFISTLYKAYGQNFISDDSFLAWVGTLSAVCNAGGRIMWGSLADRYSFKVAMLCLCAMFTSLMLTLAVTSIEGKWMFLVWVALLFLAFSGNYSLMPTATARSFGQAHVSSNYGIVFTSQVVTSPIGAVLSSQLKDAIGWEGLFYMIAAFSFVSFLLAMAFKVKRPDGSDV